MKSTVPVAVVGLGAFTPGATDVAGFWRTVLSGRDMITDVPASHWLVSDYYDPDPSAEDKTYGRRGAFLSPVDFDPLSFGIPPKSVQATDTTQLLSLMVADAVLRDYSGSFDRDRVSVILGAAPLELLYNMASRLQRPVWLKSLREAGIPEAQAVDICDRIAAHYVPWQEASFPGMLSNVIAGRIANRFDLHGTNCTTDAACASSLAAVSSAVNELSLGLCDMVLTGGVDTLNDILMYMCFSKTPALSPTGDCRPFSASADGTMLGEGLVMFALKRLDDAASCGDRIYAVIRGVGTASDGKSTAIYAPLPEGQSRALTRAYSAAGYSPATVELVEAHGTGTVAGDAAEFAALRSVFSASGRTDTQWCALGSVKSQIGHTKAAAGAAGMLKAVLSLQHKVLPPTIKVDSPNPALDLSSSPLYLNTSARPWVRGSDHPRRASVSSFGFGGSNFHLALEEYTGPSRAWRSRATPCELVLLSASTVDSLVSSARALSGTLTSVARRTQASFNASAPHRLAIVATSSADLSTRVEQFAARRMSLPGIWYSASVVGGDVAFLFPGQGSQYVGMGADVAMHFPQAAAVWDSFASLGLHQIVFPVPAFDGSDAQQAALTATENAQPALALTSLALLSLLDSLGVSASCVAGHSFGELVALHHAGVLSASDLLALARRRGELMRDAAVTPGAMFAVTASRLEVSEALASHTDWWIANHNSPSQVIVSTTGWDITSALAGFPVRRLQTATAFHSPVVASASAPLLDFLSSVPVASPSLPVYGNSAPFLYPASPDSIRARVASHLATPVDFVAQVEEIYAAGVRTFIEVGAGTKVSRLASQILGSRPHLAVSLDRAGRDGVTALFDGLAQLAVAGVPMDYTALWAGYAPEPEVNETKPRMTMPISGANHDRPYPPAGGTAALPAPNPEPAATPAMPQPAASAPIPAVTAAPAAPSANAGWLAAFQEMQRQTAEVHAAYQRAMTEAHLTYLRAAEASLRSLAAVEGLAAQPVAVQPVAVQPPPLAPLPAPVPAEPVALATPPATPPSLPLPTLPKAPADDLRDTLLSVVADKTGYPADMLQPDMELEGDLGIDSIKRVEILSALRAQVPNLPEVNVADLGKLRTLGEIAAVLGDGPGPTPVLSRSIVKTIPQPAPGLAAAGLHEARLVVTDDGAGVANEVVNLLAEQHIKAEVVTEVPRDTDGVIFLGGLRENTDQVNAEALRAARQVADRAKLFVVVQNTGGDFGLSGSAPDRTKIGTAALARCAAKEWPDTTVKVIDVTEDAARHVVDELLHGGDTLDVAYSNGVRHTVVTEEVPVGATAPLTGVVVATGGARGVTAAAMVELARQHRPKLVLIGRTPLESADIYPTDEAELKRVIMAEHGRDANAVVAKVLAGREIRANLARIREAGSEVRYEAVDVTDAEALARTLDEVRRQWGPITGVVHGAGVLADKRIADLTDEQYAYVVDTKVNGLQALLAATRNDPVTHLCLFSSIAARVGNAGQSAYAIANEVLNQVAAAEQAKDPTKKVVSIAWGAWDGGMVTPSLANHFHSIGVPLIPIEQGAQMFVDELTGTGQVAQVVIAPHGTHSLDGHARTFRADIRLSDFPMISDHVIDGTPVLPMALALEWFAAATEHHTLLDLTVSRRITGDDERITLRGRGTAIELCTGVPHYRAVLGEPSDKSLSWVATGAPAELAYDGFPLFHGPRFQALTALHAVSDESAAASVIGARTLGWEGEHWRTDPAAVDGCLQLALLWGQQVFGGNSVPMGVREFRLHRPGLLSGEARCVLAAGWVRDGRAECDVALLDSDGTVRAELFGVSLVRHPQ